jgi:pimeloyl-ACP methyl ester carboxylesterase
MKMSPAILDDYEQQRERLDIIGAAEGLRVPLLVVHGGNDESVPSDEGRLIAARTPEASLVVIGRASHTYNAIHPLVTVPFELVIAAEVSAHFISAHA